MLRATLPFEDFLGYPARDKQVLQSTVSGVRSWGNFVFQKGTFAERQALAAPQSFDLFLQIDASGVIVDGADQDPPGLYFYYNEWTPSASVYNPQTDKYYPIAVYLLASDPAQPQLGFTAPR